MVNSVFGRFCFVCLFLFAFNSHAQQTNPDAFITTWEVTADDLSISLPVFADRTFTSYTVNWDP